MSVRVDVYERHRNKRTRAEVFVCVCACVGLIIMANVYLRASVCTYVSVCVLR